MDHENYCSHCKWSDRLSGDQVPYGPGMTKLPNSSVCECPHWDVLDDDPCEATNDGKDCEFFE